MKRMIISAVLLTTCIAFSLYTSIYVENVCRHMGFLMDLAFEALENEDDDALEAYVDQISDYWDEEEETLIRVVRRTQIDEISRIVSRLRSLQQHEEYGELCAELSCVNWQMDIMQRNEQMHWHNIF